MLNELCQILNTNYVVYDGYVSYVTIQKFYELCIKYIYSYLIIGWLYEIYILLKPWWIIIKCLVEW